jgi:hypothetical protein
MSSRKKILRDSVQDCPRNAESGVLIVRHFLFEIEPVPGRNKIFRRRRKIGDVYLNIWKVDPRDLDIICPR